MSLFDKILERVAPSIALKRAKSRHLIKAYEAADSSTLHRPIKRSGSADTINQGAVKSIRDKARYLDRNHDLARAVLDSMVDNIVGQGIRPEPQVRLMSGDAATEVNDKLLNLWKDFVKAPEVTKTLDEYSAQRLEVRTWLRDGEVFIQQLEGKIPALKHGTVVPYSIELIEPDLIPETMTVADKRIISGVGLSVWGEPKNYYVWKDYPDSLAARSYSIPDFSSTKKICADRMIHIKFADRIRQTRCVSVFSSIFN